MKRSRLFIFFSILTIIVLFGTAALIDRCAILSGLRVDEGDNEKEELKETIENIGPEEEISEEVDKVVSDETAEKEELEETEVQSGEGTDKDEEGEESVEKGNNSPVVNDIVFSNPFIVPGLKYDVTAIAVDSDGDSLTYKWTITGGTLSDDSANPMIWTAPNIEGNYGVSVMVEDPEGEWNSRIEWVDVMYRQVEMQALLTLDCPLVPSESGWIERNGEVYPDSDVYGLYVGDSDQNKHIKTLVSFDITGFTGGTIQDVIFTFNFPYQDGDPSFYDHFYIYVVDWGPRELIAEDYFLWLTHIIRFPYSRIITGAISVTDSNANELLKRLFLEAVEQGKSRFQIVCELQSYEFASQYSTDNDNAWDIRVSPSEVSLKINYNP